MKQDAEHVLVARAVGATAWGLAMMQPDTVPDAAMISQSERQERGVVQRCQEVQRCACVSARVVRMDWWIS